MVFLPLRDLLRRIFPVDGVPEGEDCRGWRAGECVWVDEDTAECVCCAGFEYDERRLVLC